MWISGRKILGKAKKRIPVPIPDSLFDFLKTTPLAYPHIPKAIFDVLTTEFGHNPRVYPLFNEFLRVGVFRRKFVAKLLDVVRGKAGDSWEVRRLATLMLQHQVLLLAPDNRREFGFLFTQLNLKARGAVYVKDAVLREGYATTELERFIVEFRRKLERFNRVHRQIKGRTTSVQGLLDFIHLSRQDCKLPLARYLFTPEEVVNRLLNQIKVSTGKNAGRSHAKEADRALAHLPEFEASILRRLREDARIYWVAETTSSSLNALVEYPLTTVVLVIKPPGSEVEFEIKRAGRKGLQPLNVVYMREGKAVPTSHRLDGASKDRHLRWEASATSMFARVFRRTHGRAAPVGTIISIASTETIPVGDTEVPLCDYFTDEHLFGAGFSQMREALEHSVEAFRDNQCQDPSKRGSAGLTREFLQFTSPGQAIFSGTSSFRLDRLAAYLSGKGPEQYFKEGLGVGYTPHQARRFADDVLEEVLGVYAPPDSSCQHFEQYVEAAYAVPENRLRADHTYMSLMQQIGAFWGILLGMRGYSWGESFVARNVALRSVWEDGQWTVKLIFMDHDNLRLMDNESKDFRPAKALRGMQYDERYILGRPGDKPADKSERDHLEAIYRVGARVQMEGNAVFNEALKQTYKATQNQLTQDPDLQKHFHETFVHRLRDWDAIAENYLRARDDPSAPGAWKEDAYALLYDKGYELDLIKEHLRAVEKHADFLTRYSFLFV